MTLSEKPLDEDRVKVLMKKYPALLDFIKCSAVARDDLAKSLAIVVLDLYSEIEKLASCTRGGHK